MGDTNKDIKLICDEVGQLRGEVAVLRETITFQTLKIEKMTSLLSGFLDRIPSKNGLGAENDIPPRNLDQQQDFQRLLNQNVFTTITSEGFSPSVRAEAGTSRVSAAVPKNLRTSMAASSKPAIVYSSPINNNDDNSAAKNDEVSSIVAINSPTTSNSTSTTNIKTGRDRDQRSVVNTSTNDLGVATKTGEDKERGIPENTDETPYKRKVYSGDSNKRPKIEILFLHNPINVRDIYDEFTKGFHGQPPLRELDRRYGKQEWRGNSRSKELKRFQRRKKLCDAIDNGVNKYNKSIDEIIEYIEEFRGDRLLTWVMNGNLPPDLT